MQQDEKIIWTIGHSTRSLAQFIALLHSVNIKLLADIRSYPGSARYPHFNKLTLTQELSKQDVLYCHLPELGGRRKPEPDSTNAGWRHAAFRGYADYMKTSDFRKGIDLLEKLGEEQPTAYMCSEAVWWKCHRSLVSDYLKARGWKVMHISGPGITAEHPYTKPAQVIQGELFYP